MSPSDYLSLCFFTFLSSLIKKKQNFCAISTLLLGFTDMIDTAENNSSTLNLTTMKNDRMMSSSSSYSLSHNHQQTPHCTSSSRIAGNTKKALLTELGIISPTGVLSTSSSSSNSIVVIDAIKVFEQGEQGTEAGGLLFEKEDILEVNDQDAKEKRRRNELLLDNFDSIVRDIYAGYESRQQKDFSSAAEDDSSYDSDCESDYEEEDEE